jgi:hypothetical protein
MTPEDAKIIFSNVSELAMFSDMFTEELELALGDVVEGGRGDDFVGALFLRIVSSLFLFGSVALARVAEEYMLIEVIDRDARFWHRRYPIWNGRTRHT